MRLDNHEALHQLLRYVAMTDGVSDLNLLTGWRPYVEIEGIHQAVDGFDMALSKEEMTFIANQFYHGSAAMEEMNRTREGINTAYMVHEHGRAMDDPLRGKRFRFRVNMMRGVDWQGGANIQITVRPLPGIPKMPEEYGIPPEVMDNFWHPEGIVLITAPTGNGKTTLLGSMVRKALEDLTFSTKFVTVEDPVEIIFENVLRDMLNRGITPTSMVHQSEVPTSIKSFAAAVREFMRRHPGKAIVGELRDLETINAAIEIALTGHQVLATTHTTGVVATIQRLISGFPLDEKLIKKQDFLYTMRLIVSQRLIRGVNGKKFAIREWMIFDREARNKLLDTPLANLYVVLQDMVPKHGQSWITDLNRALKEGRLSPESYKILEAEYG
ncbi:hypothetical protein A4U49_04330 [Acidithiobacillus ferrivorans]|uniref:type IV pilus twitching motility protein PilT n=1 Tax=Acidithiobacillus ferrivorans TaxID=160808 RepID=UPI000892C3C8|nr:ATPase, T2SS/T4P/T4SS family [Acidithiobacillus ferrivorans]OFA17014.1 hypothetical protein A4U49_04330 [Acidithiobacillus ferrivorans]